MRLRFFFEFLGRFNSKLDANFFEDQAEQRVLWNLEAILENQLSERFASDFRDILKKARDAVRDLD